MTTKLVRLVNDKKKSVNNSGKNGRDIETEEYVSDLESKISDLDMINKRLKENVLKNIQFNNDIQHFCKIIFSISFKAAEFSYKRFRLKKIQLVLFITM